MKEYVLYMTHKGKNARYVIKLSTDKAPCGCMWIENSRYATLYEAIEAKNALEKE